MPRGLPLSTLIGGILSLIIGWFPIIGLIIPIGTMIVGVIAWKKSGSADSPEKGLITAGLSMALIILIFNLVLSIFMGVRTLQYFSQ